MPTGHLALFLHAHLPFVRHPEHENFLEEEWLYEAITETYLPLIAMMQRLKRDAVSFRLAMSLTPPLCAMLRDELLQSRYVRHIERLIALAQSETERHRGHAQLQTLSHFYLKLFTESRRAFVEEWNCDLVAAFRQLQDDGCIEIVACAATHGLLPLMIDCPAALRAQVLIGLDDYREKFGRNPVGFWLPECAYSPELDAVLQAANIRWFVLDSHGLTLGEPRPRFGIYAPCYTPAGSAVFARDRDSSRQVWSAEEGFPGHAAYRDFYRDLGFDLPAEYLQRFLPASQDRNFTGVKFHRVTGKDVAKDWYDPSRAESVAHTHAAQFLDDRRKQFAQLRELESVVIVLSPFDAELFGHWWFEGPIFLESFIRLAAQDPNDFVLSTPGDYLAAHPVLQVVRPKPSSWGENGHWGVWLHPSNGWIYPHLQAAARRMSEVARAHAANEDPATERVLKQLVRELLLAQSSDWAFLMKSGTAVDYATARTKAHLLRFNRLYEQFAGQKIDGGFLANCEWRDNIFPDVNWRHYS
jgi:1,4-alpha-glucan branching enzyme